MTDGVIKGTGNSRYLKSVADFLTLYPDYQSFAQALVDGTLPIDLNGINESGWETIGTALNKRNLLSDSTTTLLEIEPETATVDSAINKLHNETKNVSENISFVKLGSVTSDVLSTSVRLSFENLPLDIRRRILEYYIYCDKPLWWSDGTPTMNYNAYITINDSTGDVYEHGNTTREYLIISSLTVRSFIRHSPGANVVGFTQTRTNTSASSAIQAAMTEDAIELINSMTFTSSNANVTLGGATFTVFGVLS